MRIFRKIEAIEIGVLPKISEGNVISIIRRVKNNGLLVNGEIVYNGNVSETVVYSDNIYFYTYTGELYFYKVSESKIRKLYENHSIFPMAPFKEFGVLGDWNSGRFYAISLESCKILDEIEVADIFIDFQTGILSDYDTKRFIKKIIFRKTLPLWTFDMNTLPQYVYAGELIYDSLQNFIGVFKNELWLSTKANKIVVLDLTTGELVYVYSREPDEYMNGPAASHARIAGNKIVMFHRMLTVIDVTSKQEELYVESNSYFEELKNIRIDRVSELQGDFLTFTADKLGTGYLSTVMGVFNAKTLKIEWVYEFTLDKKTSLSTLPPVLDGKRLYALDTRKSLHVFEQVED